MELDPAGRAECTKALMCVNEGEEAVLYEAPVIKNISKRQKIYTILTQKCYENNTVKKQHISE